MVVGDIMGKVIMGAVAGVVGDGNGVMRSCRSEQMGIDFKVNIGYDMWYDGCVLSDSG